MRVKDVWYNLVWVILTTQQINIGISQRYAYQYTCITWYQVSEIAKR